MSATASSSAQQQANFTLLHCDKSTSARSSPCFLYLIAKGSSLYIAKRALALLFRSDFLAIFLEHALKIDDDRHRVVALDLVAGHFADNFPVLHKHE